MPKYYAYSTTRKGKDKTYLGYVSKERFISVVSKLDNASKNWVRVRVQETGNAKHIKSMDRRKGKVFLKR